MKLTFKHIDNLPKLKKILDGRSRVFVLVDSNTEISCLPYLQKVIEGVILVPISIPAGEVSKNITSASTIWEFLVKNGCNRNDLLLNLGGGMICDLGAFVASTYKRGIEFINIPTSLLAMVDAAWGGKTGIDFHHYKNMVGTYAIPSNVCFDPVFLETLEEREWRSGIAEMIKHGIINDKNHFEKIEKSGFEFANVNALIKDSFQIKLNYVKEDFKENGLRKALNFGHTVGHAIESYMLHQGEDIRHGEAIAAGMICESWISNQIVKLPVNDFERILNLLSTNFLLPSISSFPIEELIEIMRKDKKNTNSAINCTLVSGIGTPMIDQHVSSALLTESLAFYKSLEVSA